MLRLRAPVRRAQAGAGVIAPAASGATGTLPGLVVEARGLTKRYGRRVVVDRVSLEVCAGEVLGLLGPNGSGKSTILRMLTGYLAPSGGTASVGGYDVVSQARRARACIGYVPEDVPLYPGMRADELLAFMGRMRGLTGQRLAARTDEVCAQLGLQPVRGTLIGKLSRGYRQRVAIAQAVLHRPRLLVLDEPTNGLDPRQIIELRGLVGALARDCAVLVTSHVLAEVERMAHRVAILVEGRLLKVHTLHGRDEASAWLRLRLRAPDTVPLRELLGSVPGVVLVEAIDATGAVSRWRVLTADALTPERIATVLTGAGVGLQEMTASTSDLEQLFLRLTSSGAGAAP